jgi:positive regulator of sigma E activity
VAKGLQLAPGDRVEVEIRLVSPGKAGLLLYGLPLAAFLTASLVVFFVTGNENASAVSGFSALAAAFLILFLVERGRGASARVVGKL